MKQTFKPLALTALLLGSVLLQNAVQAASLRKTDMSPKGFFDTRPTCMAGVSMANQKVKPCVYRGGSGKG